MISQATILTVIGMATVTYLCRVLGYLLLRNRSLGPRATAVMNVAPGCVLISAIAPYFVSPHPEELLALALTIFAAARFSMLPTVVIGVASLGILKAIVS
jgi:uncharacterized membrane protein